MSAVAVELDTPAAVADTANRLLRLRENAGVLFGKTEQVRPIHLMPYPKKKPENTMPLILQLPDNKEAALKAKAQAQGVSAEQYVERMLDHALEEPAVAGRELLPSIAHLQITDPEEWGRQFRAWAESHDPNLPVLSDEAMSRDSIYPDRL